MLSLTDKAADKVREIQSAEGLEEQGLRVRIIGGGCSGFSYDLYFEDETTEMDQEFQSHGIKMFVDMMSALIISTNILIPCDWNSWSISVVSSSKYRS